MKPHPSFFHRFLFALATLWSIQTGIAQEFIEDTSDIQAILAEISAFSESVMKADTTAIGQAYTVDAKIFPSNRDIISGREAIMSYWRQPKGFRITHHRIEPVEIKVYDNEAYDYGYYEGITLNPEGKESAWKGKYVILWRKVEGKWLIYLDIWNRIQM